MSRKVRTRLIDEQRSNQIFVALTCDVEMDPPWFSHDWTKRTDFGLTQGLAEYIATIEKLKAECTFYLEGCTVDEYSDILSPIKRYEIGSHGYHHEAYSNRIVGRSAPAQKIGLEERRNLLLLSEEAIRKFSGQKPKSFRAPMMHIDRPGLQLLEDHGITVDSSISNHFEGKYHPYHPTGTKTFGREMNLLEIPVTVDPDPRLRTLISKSPFNMFFHPDRQIANVTKTVRLLDSLCSRIGIPTVVCVISHVWEFSNAVTEKLGMSSPFESAIKEIESNFDVTYCNMSSVARLF